MSSNFPTSLDDLLGNQIYVDGITIIQAQELNNIQDAIDALQKKVGKDSSAVTTSHDYKIAQLESNDGFVRGWCNVAANGTVNASFNVTSVVRNSAGNYTITWDTDFSSANYSVVAIATNSNWVANYSSMAAGSVVITTHQEGYGLEDCAFCVIVCGAQ